MFSNLAVGFLFGIGFGGWVFAKVQRTNGGGNTQNSLIAAALSGFGVMILVVIILGMIFK